MILVMVILLVPVGSVNIVHAYSENAYLIVRGTYSTWIRNYYASDNTFGEWTNLDGSTCDSPAATVCGNKVYIVVRSEGGSDLYFGSWNRDTSSFSGWTWIDGYTGSAPTLTSTNDKLILVVRGGNNTIFYRFYTVSIGTWNDWATLPSGTTDDSPAAAVLGSSIYYVIKDYGSSNLLFASTNLSGGSFSGWSSISGASTYSSPTLSASQSQSLNCLCLAIRKSDNSIWYNVWQSGSGWGSWAAANGSTGDAVGVASIGSVLHFVVRSYGQNYLVHGRSALDSGYSYGWDWPSGQATSRPTFVSDPNDSSLVRDDLNTKELGIWWINDYPGTENDLFNRDNDAIGFSNDLTGDGWTRIHYYYDSSARENHFEREAVNGEDSNYADACDIFYCTGHGNYARFSFANDYDGDDVYNTTVQADAGSPYNEPSWGDTDLEWAFLCSCKNLHSAYKTEWNDAFSGLHGICGFLSSADDYYCPGPEVGGYLAAGDSIYDAWQEGTIAGQPRQVFAAIYCARIRIGDNYYYYYDENIDSFLPDYNGIDVIKIDYYYDSWECGTN